MMTNNVPPSQSKAQYMPKIKKGDAITSMKNDLKSVSSSRSILGVASSIMKQSGSKKNILALATLPPPLTKKTAPPPAPIVSSSSSSSSSLSSNVLTLIEGPIQMEIKHNPPDPPLPTQQAVSTASQLTISETIASSSSTGTAASMWFKKRMSSLQNGNGVDGGPESTQQPKFAAKQNRLVRQCLQCQVLYSNFHSCSGSSM